MKKQEKPVPIKPLSPAAKALRAKLIRALSAPDRVGFLDIETTGLSRHYHRLTLVGVARRDLHQTWIVGDDHGDLITALDGIETLVTFNGSSFDLPFLRAALPDLQLPEYHIDLRYAAKHVGLTGGQKAIEQLIGFVDRGEPQLDGAAAVVLWYRYLAGDHDALRRLIDYNRADVAGMAHLLDHIIRLMKVTEGSLFQAEPFAGRHTVMVGRADPASASPSPETRGFERRDFQSLFGGTAAENATIVGIDLTGSEIRPTGWAVMRGRTVETTVLRTDDNIFEATMREKPDLVSIDSPLSLPAGRTTVFDDDPSRTEFGIMRQCERTLKRRGVNVYPCLLPSMQRLTARGMMIAARLRGAGIPVIESYPGAAQDIVGIPRKQAGLDLLTSGLVDFGLSGNFVENLVVHDELDAITCALVGAFFLSGRYEALGTEEEDPLIIPSGSITPGRVILGVSGRIAAGKTTLARMLEQQGFTYARYSEVVDDVIRQEGGNLDRDTRQAVGWRLHKEKGQRWMGRRLLERLGPAQLCVVDGLRFPDDRAFLAEAVGAGFRHVHVEASANVRRSRYLGISGDVDEFTSIDSMPVEQGIASLGKMSETVIDNGGAIEALAEKASQLAKQANALKS